MDSANEQPRRDVTGDPPPGHPFLGDQAEARRLQREDIEATIRVCPRCLRDEFGSLRELQNTLKAEAATLETRFLEWATTPFHQRRGPHHNVWHMEVIIEGFRVLGPRYSPDIQQQLYAIDPALVTKEKRFKHSYVVPEAIRSRLEALDLCELFYEKRSAGRHQPFTSRELIDQQAIGSPHVGAYRQVPLAASRFGESMWQDSYHEKDAQALVSFYSGWPQFNALLESAKAKHRRIDLAMDADQKLLRLGWDVFDEYLLLTGRDDIISRLDRFAGNSMLPFSVEEALSARTLDQVSGALMLGDLAIIRFLADRVVPIPIVFPRIKSVPDLMRRLEAIGYPRLQASQDDDIYQRLEAIGRDIAREMDRAMVVVVNWRPLFNALRGGPPKKSR